MPADAADLTARAQMILSYVAGFRDNERRSELLGRAGIKSSRATAWFDSSKPATPTIEELTALAEAAGVPRRFAERGFEDLIESSPAELKREVAQLRVDLAGTSQTVLAATAQLASLQEQVAGLRLRQQP
jgi:transcriptional regulator with XRE-family HTH domain